MRSIIISLCIFSKLAWGFPAPQTSSSSSSATRINLDLSSSVNQIDIARKLAVIDPLTNQKLAAVASAANQFGSLTNSASQQLASLDTVQVWFLFEKKTIQNCFRWNCNCIFANGLCNGLSAIWKYEGKSNKIENDVFSFDILQ